MSVLNKHKNIRWCLFPDLTIKDKHTLTLQRVYILLPRPNHLSFWMSLRYIRDWHDVQYIFWANDTSSTTILSVRQLSSVTNSTMELIISTASWWCVGFIFLNILLIEKWVSICRRDSDCLQIMFVSLMKYFPVINDWDPSTFREWNSS